jgi:hypothetical protein
MAKSRDRILLLLGVAAPLLSCAGLPPAIQFGSMALTGMSYVVTGKGPSDHVISAFTDQDCALLRIIGSKPVYIDKQEPERLAVADAKTKSADSQPRTIQSKSLRVAVAKSRTRQSPSSLRYYLVLGSFSSASNAERFRKSLPSLRTDVTRNEHTQVGTTQYRVVTGPLAAEDSMQRKSELARTLRRDVWRLRLCVDSLREPPCMNAPTVVASR